MAFAGEIVGDECRTGAPSPLLAVAGADLYHPAQHENDLARGSMMPALIERARKLDKPHARRIKRLRLMQHVAERIDALLVDRKLDFLKARTAVVSGMEPGDLHPRSSNTKPAAKGNGEVTGSSGNVEFPFV